MPFLETIKISNKKRYKYECDECKNIFILGFLKSRLTFCCRDCMTQSRKHGKLKEKTKPTCLERYGTEVSWSTKEAQEKRKQTCIEKYGVDSPAKAADIKKKMKQTCIEKYGVDHPFKSEEIKEKIRC